MVQVSLHFVSNQEGANVHLRRFQNEHPTVKIVSVSLVPHDPVGYFMTITYSIERN